MSNFESDIFYIPQKELWSFYENFEWEKIYKPEVKKSVKTGDSCEIILKDGQVLKFTDIKVSRQDFTITYTQDGKYENQIVLEEVTELTQSFLTWNSDNLDGNEDQISDFKMKLFKALEINIIGFKKTLVQTLKNNYPNEYNQALNILVMIGKKDLESWEATCDTIQNSKKPRDHCPHIHFNYNIFIECCQCIYFINYYLIFSGRGQDLIPLKKTISKNSIVCVGTMGKNREKNQAQNVIQMLGNKNLKSWEIARECIINSKKPKQTCDSSFNYDVFLEHCETFYQQHMKRLEQFKPQEEDVYFMNVPIMIKYKSKIDEERKFLKEQKFAKNMLIMLSTKNQETWEIASSKIQQYKLPRSECDSSFNYDKFLGFVKIEYEKLYGVDSRSLSRKSSMSLAEENDFEDLRLKKFQSSIYLAPKQIQDFSKERDQAMNILAMLSKDTLLCWNLTLDAIKKKKPNDSEHVGGEFDYDQFLIQAKFIYDEYYYIPLSPKKKKN